MRELSLHILDIMQNSVVAGAKLIELTLTEDVAEDVLKFTIKDDGKGMPPEMVKAVTDPFTTSRSTRKVGLGIPLLKLAAENTGGGIELSSEEGVGTVISATFGYSHIDRQPLGDMAETVLGTVTSYEDLDFLYTHIVNGKEFVFDTRQIHEILGGVSFKMPEVTLWLSEYLKENEAELYAQSHRKCDLNES